MEARCYADAAGVYQHLLRGDDAPAAVVAAATVLADPSSWPTGTTLLTLRSEHRAEPDPPTRPTPTGTDAGDGDGDGDDAPVVVAAGEIRSMAESVLRQADAPLPLSLTLALYNRAIVAVALAHDTPGLRRGSYHFEAVFERLRADPNHLRPSRDTLVAMLRVRRRHRCCYGPSPTTMRLLTRTTAQAYEHVRDYQRACRFFRRFRAIAGAAKAPATPAPHDAYAAVRYRSVLAPGAVASHGAPRQRRHGTVRRAGSPGSTRDAAGRRRRPGLGPYWRRGQPVSRARHH